jgi:hypothetical protein
MPVISMYYFDNKQHHLPHIHVTYGEMEAVFSIVTGEKIDGSLPLPKSRLVAAWIEIHKDELAANWKLAASGQKVFRIEPLK